MISNSKVILVNHPSDWSGTPFFYKRALETLVTEVIAVGDVSDEERRLASARIASFSETDRGFVVDRDIELLKHRAKGVREQLAVHPDADAIVMFHPPDAAFLDTHIPIFIVHDATWKQFTDAYPGYSEAELLEESYRSGFATERMAFVNATSLLFMTDWAADSARKQYPQLCEKIRVVPPGANLPSAPPASLVERAADGRKAEECRLLFVGYEIYRKGLDIAMEIIECLRSKGVPAVLRIVGTSSKMLESQKSLRCYGRLEKSAPSDWELLSQLYLESFMFLLPSRAECAGIVLCEAAAFGVPAIVSNVGGMPELVSHGKTGYVVRAAENPDEYAALIARLWTDAAAYREFSRNARARYEQELNWEHSVSRLGQLIYGERAFDNCGPVTLGALTT